MIHSLLQKYFPFMVAFLLIIYMVGLVGMNTSWQPRFISLTPVNLLFTAGMLFLYHRRWNLSFLGFFMLLPATAWLVEWAGVETGVIFGHYHYGSALGPGFRGIPFLIGLNWLILIYATGVIVERTGWNILLKTVLASFLMVGIDLFIEQVAMALDFWHWENGLVPFRNYLGWFVLSLVFLLIFYSLRIERNNRMAPWIYGVQFAFFVILSILL